jgi:hypothetical protein
MANGMGKGQGAGTGQGAKPGKQMRSDGRVGFTSNHRSAGHSSNKMQSKMKMNKAMKVK